METLGLLGHKSGTLVSGISALIWETPQGSFTLLTTWDTVKSQQSVTQKKVLTRTQDCCQLDLGRPASRTVRDAFLLFMSYRLRCFVLATQQVGTALSRYSCYHYLLLLLFLWACVLVAQLCLTLCNLLEPTRLLCPWNSPSKNTGVDCHSLLQGIFQPRDQTQVSHIAGRFFTVWATREAPLLLLLLLLHSYFSSLAPAS